MSGASFDETDTGNATVLKINGRLDSVSAAELKGRIVAMPMHGKRNVVVDMQGVDFIDSSGVSALVAALYNMREYDLQLKLSGLQENVLISFQIIKLDKVFSIYPGVNEALSSF